MKHTITVIAHGQPDSFVRRVQHDPAIAVDLLTECKIALDYCDCPAYEVGRFRQSHRIPSGVSAETWLIQRLRTAIAREEGKP